MAPPQAATAKAPARRDASGSGARTRRAPLRVVGGGRRSRAGLGVSLFARVRRNPSRVFNVISLSLVLGSLLAVVVGQAFLANGQVRLTGLQNQLSLEQSSHRQAELAVSELETPARIVAAASAQLHMVRPAQVIELPYVSLSTPLPTPNVTPAPAAPPPPASAAATGSVATGSEATGSEATGATTTGATTTGATTTGATAPTTTTSTP